jgi:hypothetical protein
MRSFDGSSCAFSFAPFSPDCRRTTPRCATPRAATPPRFHLLRALHSLFVLFRVPLIAVRAHHSAAAVVQGGAQPWRRLLASIKSVCNKIATILENAAQCRKDWSGGVRELATAATLEEHTGGLGVWRQGRWDAGGHTAGFPPKTIHN